MTEYVLVQLQKAITDHVMSIHYPIRDLAVCSVELHDATI